MTSHDQLTAALERADSMLQLLAATKPRALFPVRDDFIEHNAFMKRFRASPQPPPQPQVYYRGADTHCPACLSTNWHVGRSSAECARCNHALPLAPRDAQPRLTAG